MKNHHLQFVRTGVFCLIVALLVCVLAGCTFPAAQADNNTDGKDTHQTGSTKQSTQFTQMRAAITPPSKTEQPITTKAQTVSWQKSMMKWGDVFLQAPADVSLTLWASSGEQAQSEESSISHSLHKATRNVPAQVWTYGFIGIAVGAILTVLLSGYRLIGLSICATSVLAMGSVSLIYIHGEMISYAIAAAVILCAIGATITLFCLTRQKRQSTYALKDVVQGCDKFLRQNMDTQAAQLFRQSQLSQQTPSTRKQVRKVLDRT